MKYIYTLILLLIGTTFVSPIFAIQEDYTTHNTTSDCYVKFENSVYDLTEYIPQHDRFMDIRDWCGKDMTEDFKTKAGEGVDHRTSSYALLEQYKIYDIETPVPVVEETQTVITETSIVQDTEEEIPWMDEVLNHNPYNLLVPLLLSLSLYWIPYFIIKAKKKNLLSLMPSLILSYS